MPAPILYLGDTTLETAAAYLAGVMTYAGWEFDYVPSDRPVVAETVGEGRRLFIISDYPASQISDDQQRRIVEQVAAGAGLLMIGGWESYRGLGGCWDGTPIGDALPVEMEGRDDRRNCDHPVFVQPTGAHPITADLPWTTRPPLIGGLNQIRAAANGVTILEARHYTAAFPDASLRLTPADVDPLLVVGMHGEGRTAALATDVAPHWVGPLVDWGPGRVTAQAEGAAEIEVGDLYARFFQQLPAWVGRL